MKTTIFITMILFGFLNQMSLNAQQCGTPSKGSSKDFSSTFISEKNIKNGNSICINVFFHIVRHNDGRGGFELPNIDIIINQLNKYYNPLNIQINMNGIDFIDNSKYYDLASNEFNDLIKINNISNSINFYLVNSAPYAGRAEAILSKNLVTVNKYALSPTSAHEIGHCLNLWHTHHGLGCNDTGGCKEAIDGSNCSTCGDFVCDTPADPCVLGKVNNDCEYIGGGEYKPDPKNIMSYGGNCRSKFTHDQGERMKGSIIESPLLQQVLTKNCYAIKGPSEVCSGDRPTYMLTDVPAGATIKWKFSYILNGQGTSKVQIGIFYGTDVRTLTAEVTYQGETSTFTKQISSESVLRPRSVPKIRKARYNINFLVCCSSYGGETYTLDHAECYQNCDDLEWTYTVYYSNPRDQYYFSKRGRSYDKTGTIGVQKYTFSPLIVNAKARNVNRSEQCGDEYSGYSNSFARYYGVVKKGAYSSNTFYNQALNKHVPLTYYVNRRSRSLSVKMLHIWDWLNELYLHKDLNLKEIGAIKNWLSIANENINAYVEIRHISGSVIRTQKLSEGTTNVSLNGLPKGLYVVRFTINNMVHHEVITF